MGYFSNGTEGEAYEEQYCAKCANANTDNGFCPIMNLHSSWNYEQHSDPLKKAALEHFIPRSEKGWNEQCKMFREDAR